AGYGVYPSSLLERVDQSQGSHSVNAVADASSNPKGIPKGFPNAQGCEVPHRAALGEIHKVLSTPLGVVPRLMRQASQRQPSAIILPKRGNQKPSSGR